MMLMKYHNQVLHTIRKNHNASLAVEAEIYFPDEQYGEHVPELDRVLSPKCLGPQ
jgi:hypothetical protein